MKTILKKEIKTHWACATVEPIEKIYTDQTGAFPTISSKGSRYVFILYHYDTNSILAEPIWNRTAGEILQAHQLVQHLQKRGYTLTLHILDNEVSAGVKDFDEEHKLH